MVRPEEWMFLGGGWDHVKNTNISNLDPEIINEMIKIIYIHIYIYLKKLN
jgi:hypothetical protein